jgi:hypothetical protein
MEWWIIAVLIGAALLLIQMYRLALREVRALTNYALLMLVDQGVYATQRASLVAFVRASEGKECERIGWPGVSCHWSACGKALPYRPWD